MKNIIKKIVLGGIIYLSTIGVNAQTVGNYAGSTPVLVVNRYDEDYYSQIRMQSNKTSTFNISNYGSRFGIFHQAGNTGTIGPFGIYEVNASSKDLFTITPSGNIGIGTNTPHAPLQFSNNYSTNRKIVMYADGDTEHHFYGFGVNGGILRYQVNTLGDNHVFYAGSSATSSNELMRIQGNGNVGIGTANPTYKLEVKGSALIGNAHFYATANAFVIRNTSLDISTSEKSYAFLASDDGSYTFINKKDTGRGAISFRVDNIPKVSILNNGYMGVGTESPNWLLDVAGNGYFNGNLGIGVNPTTNPQYRLGVRGTIGATNYAVVSSIAADYVFEDDYKLITLSETEAYIKANKHLPAFKSAKHYEAHGYTMIEMNVALEQTVEELTLHAIAQEKEINTMKSELAAIKAMLLAKK